MSRHLGILLGELTEPFRPGFTLDGGCDNREEELDEALEHIEQAETLVRRIAVMMRTIADQKARLDCLSQSIPKLEGALRKIANLPHPADTPSDHPAFRTMNEMRRDRERGARGGDPVLMYTLTVTRDELEAYERDPPIPLVRFLVPHWGPCIESLVQEGLEEGAREFLYGARNGTRSPSG